LTASGKYDFIFAGAGCAALSLVMRMISSGKFNEKRILLIDKSPKDQNDRTWCFWETDPGFFEEIVFKRWSLLDFYGPGFQTTFDILPYQYKMIRGSDLYKYCFEEIRKHGNIEMVYGDLAMLKTENRETRLVLDGEVFDPGTAIIFNSIPKREKDKSAIQLLQHFKGWIMETTTAVFEKNRACLMDFRVSQEHGTAFTYILPFSETKALVEYTLLTKQLLSPTEYDRQLANYINEHVTRGQYQISEQEFGVIPMTTEKFTFNKEGVFQIGAAGGQTKASSGYTFQFIQKHSDAIINQLQQGLPLTFLADTPARFRFYDNTLLRILYHEILPGPVVFTELFKKNKPQQVLRFLDNETSLKEELAIISTLPKWPFIKAAIGIR
jgi:lycopene beta-cyclase